MAIKTHYDNLKVSRTATKEEIKRAYRRLCSIHHPDKHPEQNRDRQHQILVIINKAYEVLSDDRARRLHDEWIRHEEFMEGQRKKSTNNRFEKTSEDIYRNQQNEREEWIRNEIKRREAFKYEIQKKRRFKLYVIVGLIATSIIYGWLKYPKLSSKPSKQNESSIFIGWEGGNNLKIRYYNKTYGIDEITIDLYLDNNANDFDTRVVKKAMKGILSETSSCLYQPSEPKKIVYVFHFLKGGKRIYLTLPLSHLCYRK